LGIYQPVTVFSAQINMPAIAKGERAITVTSLSGAPASVVDGMTAYFGVSAGNKNLGRIRVRAATATTITLAENSINWSNGWYLTIVRYFEPWTVMPRIVLDDDNVPIFYKDYDILYTDQNQLYDPVVCLGPHHAGFIESGITGTHQVWYTSSGSYDPTPGGGIDSYDWAFEGGNPSGSTSADPGWVTYTGCGHFTTSLEITTDDSKSFTGYRHVQILTKPENAVPGCLPIAGWGLKSLEGDRDGGGYTAGIWVRQPIDLDNIVDGSLCVIFSEDWEGTQETKVGANAENRDHTLFVGYIVKDSIRYDAVTSVVEFDVENALLVMENSSTIFTAILDDKRTASTWNELRDMTMDRALVHFLRWHSTLLKVSDFSPTGNTKNVKSQVFSGQNIYEICNTMMESSLLAHMVSDRQGKVWTEIDASVMPTGSARMATGSSRHGIGHMQDVISMTRQDWRNEISIEREPACELAYLELGGIAYSGNVTGTIDPFLSGAPGVAPDYHGGIERYSGLVIDGQAGLNEITGYSWARKNAVYPIVSIPLAGDYRFLDIAPQQRVLLNVEESDTWRRINFVEKSFIPQAISYDWSADHQVLLMDMDLREETYGYLADSVIIPTDPPWDDPRLPIWTIDFPPIIPPEPWEPPITPPEGSGGLVYVMTSNKLTRTRNGNAPTGIMVNWEDITPNYGDDGITGSMWGFWLDTADPENFGYLHTRVGASDGYIYRISQLNSATPVYTEILNPAQWDAIIGAPDYGGQLRDFSQSPVMPNVCWLLGDDDSGSWRLRIAWSPDYGVNWNLVATGERDIRDERNLCIDASEWSSPSAYQGWNAYRWGQDGLMRTQTMGGVWVQTNAPNFNELHDFVIPYEDNAGDNKLYVSSESGANKVLYYGLTMYLGDLTVITPSYDGYNWGRKRSGQRSGNYRGLGVCRHDSNKLGFWLQRAVAEPGDHAVSVFFRSTTGPFGLVPLYSINTFMCIQDWHKNNDSILWALGMLYSSQPGKIIRTLNFGDKWDDLTPAWERDIGTIGAPDNLGFNPMSLQICWTV